MEYTCTRCTHFWTSRIDRRPLACPQCNSRLWFRPKNGVKPRTESPEEQNARELEICKDMTCFCNNSFEPLRHQGLKRRIE
jgi:DNA-directed RNA polymerase subunit RPC12/RpoP